MCSERSACSPGDDANHGGAFERAAGKSTLTDRFSLQRKSTRSASAADDVWPALPSMSPALAPARAAVDDPFGLHLTGGSAADLVAPVQRRAGGEAGGGDVALPSPGSGGSPMPSATRRKMESAFGQDFSSVRVHEGAHAESIGALAYTQGTDIHFAPGQFDPGSTAGQQLLGHELAHVVQQSQGRVSANAQAKGVALNDDAALEHEADEWGARAAGHDPADDADGEGDESTSSASPRAAAAPSPPVQAKSAVVQRYFKVAHANFGVQGVQPGVGNRTPDFLGQDKDQVLGSQTEGSFLDQHGQTRTSSNAAPDLRIANAGDLAIEENDLINRQAKVFFASSAQITQSNQDLRLTGSKYQLHPTGERITVPNRAGNATTELRQVTAKNADKNPGDVNRHGPNMEVQQNCNEIVGDVTGSGTEDGLSVNKPRQPNVNAPHGFMVEVRVATFLSTYLRERQIGNDKQTALQLAGQAAQVNITINNYAGIVDDAAQEYGEVLHQKNNNQNNMPTMLRKISQMMGVNEYAQPGVGDTYVTQSIGQGEKYNDVNGVEQNHVRDYENNPGQNKIAQGAGANFVDKPWGYHWGGVVAVSGNDRVTMENYARKEEDVNAKANGINAGSETRFYFQMYGDANELDGANNHEDQSWHAVWKQLGFANPLTMAMHNRANDVFSPLKADDLAIRHYRDIGHFRNQHASLTGAANQKNEAEWLYRALAYALHFLKANSRAPRSERTHWKHAVAGVAGRHPANNALQAHVLQKITAVKKSKNLFS